MASFEDFARSELAALGDRLKTEETERKELGARSVSAVEDLAADLASRLKGLEGNLNSRYRELSEQIGQEAAALHSGKADRRDLSALFTHIAEHLNGDPASETPAADAAKK